MGAAELAFQINFETKSALGVVAADKASHGVASGAYACTGIHNAAAGAGGDGSGCAFGPAAVYHFEFIVVEKLVFHFIFLHKFFCIFIYDKCSGMATLYKILPYIFASVNRNGGYNSGGRIISFAP